MSALVWLSFACGADPSAPTAPSVSAVEPTSIGPDGGPVRLIGEGLDGVTEVFVDGVALTPRSTSATSVEVVLPPLPAGCRGHGATILALRAEAEPTASWRVLRPRPDDLRLGVGEARLLGPMAEGCVRFPAEAGSEYALAYFDTRGIESSRSAPERMFPEEYRVRVRDVTPSVSTPMSVVATIPTVAAAAPDVRGHRAVHAAESELPADFYALRDRPWVVGDTFSMRDPSAPGSGFARGRIFMAKEGFVVGTLHRDAVHDIPGKVLGLADAIEAFEDNGVSFLEDVFGVPRPTTTDGAGKMLVVIGDFGNASGAFYSFAAGVDRPHIVVNAAVPIAGGFPVFVNPNVVFHEMSHAFQDRYFEGRCAAAGDCGFGFWEYPWAVEGGAELLTEHFMATLLGFGFADNVDSPALANVFGLLSSYGGDSPHYAFSRGYASSSWLLRDWVHRVAATGRPLPDAFGEVARGALEGWYGFLPGQSGARPGLQSRLASVIPGFEPVARTLDALLALAADDVTPNPGYQVPFMRDAWTFRRSAKSFSLGVGDATEVSVNGPTFAHFRVSDPAGRGGSIQVGPGGAALLWGVARLH